MQSTETEYETLRLDEPAPGVILLTLDRPAKYNAMNNTMFGELESAALAIGDDDEARAVVITGAGKAFCSGYDLADADDLPGLGAMGMLDQQELAARALVAVRSIRIPVIAAVNGPAAGGGLSLALAADIRVASESARFNAAFVKIGLSAGDLGASWLLTRLIGPGRTSEICFTGRQVEALEALELGLVSSVHPDGGVVDAAVQLGVAIAGNSPTGVQLSKRALQANMEVTSYAAALELENRGQALLTRTQDMAEALAAFKERRAPKFVGA